MARRPVEPGAGKPFDVTTKVLLDAHPEDWLRFLEVPVAPVTLLDSDVSTLSVAADRVLHVNAPEPFLVHFEFQVSYDAGLVERSHRYNVILRTTHSLPVLTVLVLLRRDANLPVATGRYEQAGPTPDCFVAFGYRVLRLWELSPDVLLSGGIGLVPLAPLGDVSETQAARVVQAATERIVSEVGKSEQVELLASLEVLLGLRFDAVFVEQLIKGVRTMEESSVYQAKYFVRNVLDYTACHGLKRSLSVWSKRRRWRAVSNMVRHPVIASGVTPSYSKARNGLRLPLRSS